MCTLWLQGPAAGACVVAGTGCKYIVEGAQASSKGWGQLWEYWRLWGPWLSACSIVAAGSHQDCTSVEADDGGYAGSVQV